MTAHDPIGFDLGEGDPGFFVQLDRLLHAIKAFYSLEPESIMGKPVFRLILQHINQDFFGQRK